MTVEDWCHLLHTVAVEPDTKILSRCINAHWEYLVTLLCIAPTC